MNVTCIHSFYTHVIQRVRNYIPAFSTSTSLSFDGADLILYNLLLEALCKNFRTTWNLTHVVFKYSVKSGVVVIVND